MDRVDHQPRVGMSAQLDDAERRADRWNAGPRRWLEIHPDPVPVSEIAEAAKQLRERVQVGIIAIDYSVLRAEHRGCFEHRLECAQQDGEVEGWHDWKRDARAEPQRWSLSAQS